MKSSKKIKEKVRESYANIARGSGNCCCSNKMVQRQSGKMGYSDDEMNKVPCGSNSGLGCGNPVAIASLKIGETVLDLGSGAGFDAFLAAGKVGKDGRVIGVDMTDEMLEKARKYAQDGGYKNVEFRKGDIENLPVKDKEIDVVISNCVINLAPDKERVFREVFRVLKEGGRLMVSDVMLTKPLPQNIREDEELLSACVSGAILKSEYLGLLKNIGFKNIKIHKEFSGFLEEYTVSVTFSAEK